MSDCSPLRLADNGHSSPGQSSDGRDSSNSQQNQHPNRRQHHHHRREDVSNHRNRDDNERIHRTSSESISSGKLQIRYGARDVVELIVPVSLCMLIVVGTMRATDSYRYSSQQIIWGYAQVMFTDHTSDTGTRVWHSVANALIMLVFIVAMTSVLILLYQYRCYAIIHGWLLMSSLILLFIFAILYIAEILKIYNVPMDYITLALFIWNFGIVGLICIHWKGPLILQQGYLITISALLALVFIRSLPDWTTWTVLGAVSIWDLIAVLCPRGPLRILVETAQERNEPIFPALIYSSTMAWEFTSTVIASAIGMADNNGTKKDKSNQDQHQSNRNYPRRNRRKNSESGKRGQPAASPSAAGPSNRRNRAVRPNDISSPSTRTQHPVEVNYEDGAQPPEVAIVQPSISGTSADWTSPNVRATTRQPKHDRASRNDAGNSTKQTRSPRATSVDLPPVSDDDQDDDVIEERGVKLGLGDFIFYSLLVGKASTFDDWTIILACYLAILVGLCVTLSLLAVFRKALPALPISIAIGLITLFLSNSFAIYFAESLTASQVFI